MDFDKRQTELVRLLRLTSDNKSPVILGLRKLIQSYVNDCEAYISGLEMSNDELTTKVIRLKQEAQMTAYLCKLHSKRLKSVITKQIK